MSNPTLTETEKNYLLELARRSIECAVSRHPLPTIDPGELTPLLRAPGAAFVTLTQRGQLRGCIGALEAYQPLAEDVREHAAAAATEDYRFSPVRPEEVPSLEIEISRLTPSQPLPYENADDLLKRLRVGIDGVILRDGFRRATFLPQVWDQIPDPAQFLTHLCQKMGAPGSLWRSKKLDVAIYQVEEFHETAKTA